MQYNEINEGKYNERYKKLNIYRKEEEGKSKIKCKSKTWKFGRGQKIWVVDGEKKMRTMSGRGGNLETSYKRICNDPH